jgi:hypothetical protein
MISENLLVFVENQKHQNRKTTEEKLIKKWQKPQNPQAPVLFLDFLSCLFSFQTTSFKVELITLYVLYMRAIQVFQLYCCHVFLPPFQIKKKINK